MMRPAPEGYTSAPGRNPLYADFVPGRWRIERPRNFLCAAKHGGAMRPAFEGGTI